MYELIICRANDDALFAHLLKLLKPNGTIWISEPELTKDALTENLKLSGFINIAASNGGTIAHSIILKTRLHVDIIATSRDRTKAKI